MKKTIQEFRNRLFSKEILSEHDLLRLRGGDGEEDKRRELGRSMSMSSGSNNNNATSGTPSGTPSDGTGSTPP
jgi:hypothetical protein